MKRYDWHKILGEYDSNKESIKQYCERLGIPQTSFYNGRKRANPDSKTKSPLQSFIPVSIEQ